MLGIQADRSGQAGSVDRDVLRMLIGVVILDVDRRGQRVDGAGALLVELNGLRCRCEADSIRPVDLRAVLAVLLRGIEGDAGILQRLVKGGGGQRIAADTRRECEEGIAAFPVVIYMGFKGGARHIDHLAGGLRIHERQGYGELPALIAGQAASLTYGGS